LDEEDDDGEDAQAEEAEIDGSEKIVLKI